MSRFTPLLLTVPLFLAACGPGNTQVKIPDQPQPSPAAACGLAPASIQVNPAVSQTDSCFAQQAAMSDMFEIQSSKLALSRSSNDAVKAFANQIIADHNDASAKLKQKADALKIALPTSLDAPKLADMQALQVKQGAAFDRAYAAVQVNAHVDAVNLFENYIAKGTNADLKAHAQDTLPHLKHHLELARTLVGAAK